MTAAATITTTERVKEILAESRPGLEIPEGGTVSIMIAYNGPTPAKPAFEVYKMEKGEFVFVGIMQG